MPCCRAARDALRHVIRNQPFMHVFYQHLLMNVEVYLHWTRVIMLPSPTACATILDLFGKQFVLLIIGGEEIDCEALKAEMKSRGVPFETYSYPKLPELIAVYNRKYLCSLISQTPTSSAQVHYNHLLKAHMWKAHYSVPYSCDSMSFNVAWHTADSVHGRTIGY